MGVTCCISTSTISLNMQLTVFRVYVYLGHFVFFKYCVAPQVHMSIKMFLARSVGHRSWHFTSLHQTFHTSPVPHSCPSPLLLNPAPHPYSPLWPVPHLSASYLFQPSTLLFLTHPSHQCFCLCLDLFTPHLPGPHTYPSLTSLPSHLLFTHLPALHTYTPYSPPCPSSLHLTSAPIPHLCSSPLPLISLPSPLPLTPAPTLTSLPLTSLSLTSLPWPSCPSPSYPDLCTVPHGSWPVWLHFSVSRWCLSRSGCTIGQPEMSIIALCDCVQMIYKISNCTF